MKLKYSSCPYVNDFYTSKQVERNTEQKKGGGKFMEVNIRAVYGMRSIGVGHTPLKTLCLYMNMPEPMGNDNYNNIAKTVRDATKVVAEQSMADSAKEVRR